MQLDVAQEGACLCGRVRYQMLPPCRLEHGFITADLWSWSAGADWLVAVGDWRICKGCVSTLGRQDGETFALLAQLNVPLDSLHDAACTGDLKGVREALARGVPVDVEINNSTPLMVALERGRLAICRELLAHGAQVRWLRDIPLLCPRKRLRPMLEVLLQNGLPPQGLLGATIRTGDVNAVRILLECGANTSLPDEFGTLPLHTAAQTSMQMLNLLLAHTIRLDQLSGGGGHALGHCARWGLAKRLRRLLESGFPVDLLQRDPADSALFAACRHGQIECARMLLDYGADPNLDCHKVTPLMAAARHGSAALVRLLLERGADALVSDRAGRLAGDYVLEPSVRKPLRTGLNSAGEACVAMPLGRGCWTLCQHELRRLLPASGIPGAAVPDGLHSIDFQALADDSQMLDQATWRQARRAAHAGDTNAQYLLGSRRWNGPGERWNKWLRLAARAGHPEAMRRIGSWGRRLLRAAQAGSLQAMRDYAASMVDLDKPGNGYDEALPWYRHAAEGGHRESQVAAGSMLIQGDGAEADFEVGRQLLEKAAQANHCDDLDDACAAACQLARYYRYGPLPVDAEKAEYWRLRERALSLENQLERDRRIGAVSRRNTP